MKKFITICAAMLLGLGSMLAQENYKAVKGYVVDKNGNPIPGAEVKDSKGESTITDHDGSFMLNVPLKTKKIVASYDGMATQSRRIKADKDLVFTLQKGRTNPVFLNAIIGGGYNPRTSNPQAHVGVMFGRLSNWGYYIKANVEPFVAYDFSTTIGVIKNLSSQKIFLYAGLGYGMNSRVEYMFEDHRGWNEYHLKSAAACDLGFIFKTSRHFNVSVGYNLIVNSTAVNSAQLGFGYVF
ncbi:MAG: hypothetical protein HDS64_05335 [Bacteroidales bacterium]|nr:hypothetical protein [Bacteroidales bacterium]